MFNFQALYALGNKTVRHTVLVTALVVSILIATSYFFLLGLENKNLITEMNNVFSKTRADIHTSAQQILYENASLVNTLETISNENATTTAMNAVINRAIENSATLTSVSVFSATGSRIVGTHEWSQPTQTGVDFNQNTMSLNYWKATDTQWIALTHTVEPIMREVSVSLSSTLYPATLHLTLTQLDQPLTFTAGKDGISIVPANSEHTSKMYSRIPTDFTEIISQQKPIELVDASNERYHILLGSNTSVLHTAARRLLGWLLITSLPLLLLATLLAKYVGKSITEPIYEMARKLQTNQEGVYEHSIHTKDELEQLDTSIAQITAKLSEKYQNLESKVEHTAAEIMKYSSREHAIFDAISLGILVVDTDGIIQEANRSIATTLERDIRELIGESVYSELHLLQKQIELSTENNPIRKALFEEKEIRIQPDEHLSLVTPKQDQAIRMIISPIKHNQELRGAVVVIQDASQEYLVEQLKSEFIGVASHQLRTPLASIQWYSELLSSEGSENFTNEQRQFMVELRLAAQKLSNVINELMDASRLHDGQIEIRPKDLDLIALLKSNLEEFKALALVKHITLELGDLPEQLHITSDPVLLNIVIQNLISNAIKYSFEQGTVQINLRVVNNAIEISVHDDGIGVPHKDKNYIFQKMYRGSNAKKVSTDGSGLGLYATRKILRILGGSIHFKSQEGRGTTFTITLPHIEKSTN